MIVTICIVFVILFSVWSLIRPRKTMTKRYNDELRYMTQREIDREG